MTTATELLSRALKFLDYRKIGSDTLEKDIKTFVAAEPEAEPVAWMFQHEDTGLIDYVETQQVEWGFEKNNPRWQKIGPLYLHPPRLEPARKPLSDVEIADIYYRGTCFEKGYLSAFAEGFRQAEKHHGFSSSIPSLNDTISANNQDSGP